MIRWISNWWRWLGYVVFGPIRHRDVTDDLCEYLWESEIYRLDPDKL